MQAMTRSRRERRTLKRVDMAWLLQGLLTREKAFTSSRERSSRMERDISCGRSSHPGDIWRGSEREDGDRGGDRGVILLLLYLSTGIGTGLVRRDSVVFGRLSDEQDRFNRATADHTSSQFIRFERTFRPCLHLT